MTTEDGIAIGRDEFGNALGGIRTPAVDVPVSTPQRRAHPPAVQASAQIFGSTVPFDGAQLTDLYTDPAGYLEAFEPSLDEAVAAGYVLEPEADTWRRDSAAFTW